MNNIVLKIKNLAKTYYTKDSEVIAIKDFSFEVKEDSIVAIVGPSGCGKSTLLNIIGGLEEKTDGKIYDLAMAPNAQTIIGKEYR